jgi:hypothetical protein
MTLKLSENEIGIEGGQYIADALKINTVRSLLYHMRLFHLMQTLTTLDIGWNKVGVDGTKHLANALQHNTVRVVLYSSTSYIFVSFIAET